MIQSMTGYGKHIVQLPGKKITVEVKSLNSKNLDINARVPQTYREKELDFRNAIARSLNRGKIDFSLFVEWTGDQTTAEVNEGVVRKYMEQLRGIAAGEPAHLLEMALRLPDALKTEREELDPEEYKAVEKALEEALRHLQAFREEEGQALESEFSSRLAALRANLQEVEALDKDRLSAVRERLEKAVAELKENVDANRFEQELIYYLEKYDITEEKVRLGKHLDHFEQTMAAPESNGKKLGFITQEMGREINTMGSKANDAAMQRVVVQMKDDLEKIKEQILNVL